MDFPAAHLSLPMEAVPLSVLRRGVAFHATRLPLSPHCNPFFARNDSLGDFHHSPSVSLASFADRVSKGDRGYSPGRGEKPRCSLIHPPHSRQATSAHSVTAPGRCTALQVHNLFRTRLGNTTTGVRPRTRTGLHGNRVGITMPLESALSPQARKIRASPQHPPKTGRFKQAPRVSSICPLEDF